MNNSTHDKLYSLCLQKILSSVSSLLGAHNNDEALDTVNEVLYGVDLSESRYFVFLYYKAVALYNKGLVLDSFPIFAKLFSERPYYPNYFQSFNICITRLNAYALDLVAKNSSDEKILTIYHLLTQYHYASFKVCEAAAVIYAMRGQRDIAKDMIAKRLALSPNDLDLISSAIKIAKILEDQKWIHEIRTAIKLILKRYPFR